MPSKGQVKDLTGQVFGELTVMEQNGWVIAGDGTRNAAWSCVCSCGKKLTVKGGSLTSGSAQACGHNRGKIKDLTGQVFGRLTVIGQNGWYTNPKEKNRTAKWECKCSCGTIKTITGVNLTSKRVVSCGCYGKEARFGNSYKTRICSDKAFWALRINTYKQGAKSRGHNYDLSDKVFQELSVQNCHYCGSIPRKIEASKNLYLSNCKRKGTLADVQFSETKVKYANGIDRVNNSKGYVLGNVVPCCTICNRAKLDLTMGDWGEWLSRIASHQSQLKGVTQ